MNFREHFENAGLPGLRRRMDSIGEGEVRAALSRKAPSFQDFMALLSPAAARFLEPMARKAGEITVRRFGRTILMYAPLYVSNECSNLCRYCGFRASSGIGRITLDDGQIDEEAAFLKGRGFRHLLLVSGEAPGKFTVARLCDVIRRLSPSFPSITIEVQALSEEDYRAVAAAGAEGVTLYQETYDRGIYSEMHPAGPKRDFDFRLAAPERAGAAGMRRLGIGALLGLGDFRAEGLALGLHASYLTKRFWRSNVSVSVPRIRNAPDGFSVPGPVSDADLVQLMLALRIFLPDSGLVLSTRERKEFRDRLIPLGVTQMSAGSMTDPGGYCQGHGAGQQFAVEDRRSPAEVAAAIDRAGFEPVWKDWDALLCGGPSEEPRSESLPET